MLHRVRDTNGVENENGARKGPVKVGNVRDLT